MSACRKTRAIQINGKEHHDKKAISPSLKIGNSNLRSAYMDWISNHQGQNLVFVTLATNCENSDMNWPSPDEKRKYFLNKVNSWDASVCRHFIGKRYTEHIDKRQSGLLWIEHENTNIHYHGSIDIHSWDISEYTEVCRTNWKRFVPSGTINVQPVADPKRLVGYMMKEQNEWSLKNKLDQIIFLPHPNKSRNFRLL